MLVKRGIKLFFVIFLFCFMVGPVLAETELRQADVDYDYLYFTKSKSPYRVKETLILHPGQTIKIDTATQFIFDQGATLCLRPGECLKGDWIFQDGLGNTEIKVYFNTYVTLEDVATSVRYITDYYFDSSKTIGLTPKSSFDSVFVVKAKDLESTRPYEMLVYLPEVFFDPELRFNGLPPYKYNYNPVSGTTGENGTDQGQAPNTNAGTGYQKLPSSLTSGKIFLQVEENGEAWYVYPQNNKRYYLGRPADAFRIMRELALGVNHDFITSNVVFPERVAGMILLDVEDNGRAYYINPGDRRAYYLGRPDDAFRIMREQGIGITNANLDKIDK